MENPCRSQSASLVCCVDRGDNLLAPDAADGGLNDALLFVKNGHDVTAGLGGDNCPVCSVEVPKG